MLRQDEKSTNPNKKSTAQFNGLDAKEQQANRSYLSPWGNPPQFYVVGSLSFLNTDDLLRLVMQINRYWRKTSETMVLPTIHASTFSVFEEASKRNTRFFEATSLTIRMIPVSFNGEKTKKFNTDYLFRFKNLTYLDLLFNPPPSRTEWNEMQRRLIYTSTAFREYSWSTYTDFNLLKQSLPHLTDLRLENVSMPDQNIKKLKELPLQTLSLIANLYNSQLELKGEGLTGFSNLKKLTLIDKRENPPGTQSNLFKDEIDCDALSTLQALEELRVSAVQKTLFFRQPFSHLIHLHTLILDNLPFIPGDEFKNTLIQLTQLRTLAIEGFGLFQITKEYFLFLTGLNHLETLVLCARYLTLPFLSWKPMLDELSQKNRNIDIHYSCHDTDKDSKSYTKKIEKMRYLNGNSVFERRDINIEALTITKQRALIKS